MYIYIHIYVYVYICVCVTYVPVVTLVHLSNAAFRTRALAWACLILSKGP